MPKNNKPGRRLLRQLYGSWYRVRHNISIFARWCLFAVIIGVVVGAVGAAFEHALEWATETRQEQSWTLYFLPLFAMEVISVGVMYYAAQFPSILASVIAHQVALQLGGGTTAFTLSGVPENTDVLLIVKLVAFGVVCAGLSALVCVIFHKIGHLFKHFLPNQNACIAVGGAVVVLISLLLGTRDYNGAGMQVIERAIAGHAAYEAFFLKLVLTAITIGVGYKGGEIVPVLFIGATFGAAYGGFFGLAPSFAAGLGMTAVFCGVTNSPLTSILLAYELFGGQSLALFALVIAISYMLSGYYGLYSEQKIIYSKLRPQFIDRKTK